MITLKPANKPTPSNQQYGLALAGGGPLGGFYELGALCALQDSIKRVDLTDLDVYVGVSAGAFIAAGLANGISLPYMCDIFASNKKTETPFNPDHFLQPAYKDYVKNLAKTPLLVGKSLLKWAKNPLHTSIVDMLEVTGKALPTGVFNNSKLEHFLNTVFTKYGQSNDFRELSKKLYIIACELNSGKIATFSTDNNSDVPISKAVQASSALPGLYSPVKIKNQMYVDGALRRTMNASAALKQGVHLLFAINPIVPFKRSEQIDDKGLVEGGLPLVLSQTFRSVVQSRLKTGLAKYKDDYPEADIILVEPDQNDEVMFKSNLFSYSQRANLCDYAYRHTRQQLIKRKDEINAILERHGLAFNNDNLNDNSRDIESFINNKPSQVSWSDQINSSLDALERQLKAKS
ncbi:patatin-like phospholipase family protein [Marinicella rhabdoformis]|uniref:patatin-like phospholipase family protein n=1 Tax=Marinicella rhabdoformis TaxID=2580566 RepID=UPI0012AED0E1|nr:patatin-like phospholipase family protein [Marinicella rhabdoformis]